ncbi:hypothetical protein A5641_29010 [Mycobacterium sp. 1554424.7]|nr:hypothetical protein A5641_29010 [Mycobacterium sp. 1554424.7]
MKFRPTFNFLEMNSYQIFRGVCTTNSIFNFCYKFISITYRSMISAYCVYMPISAILTTNKYNTVWFIPCFLIIMES